MTRSDFYIRYLIPMISILVVFLLGNADFMTPHDFQEKGIVTFITDTSDTITELSYDQVILQQRLYRAVKLDDLVETIAVLKAGADPNIKSGRYSFAKLAFDNNSIEILDTLWTYGMQDTCMVPYLLTLPNRDITHFYLEKTRYINCSDDIYGPALVAAVRHGNPQYVNKIISSGADRQVLYKEKPLYQYLKYEENLGKYKNKRENYIAIKSMLRLN